jgi:hypothetical protein
MVTREAERQERSRAHPDHMDLAELEPVEDTQEVLQQLIE